MPLLKKFVTFAGGVHPPDSKERTAHLPIRRMPFVKRYIIPLIQHIGAPSRCIVTKGQRVKRGEKIAEPGGFVSVAQHSPVDGTVVDVGLFPHPRGDLVESVVIEADPLSEQVWIPRPFDEEALDTKEFLTVLQEGGIVGLGGAGFPTHVKFSFGSDKKLRYLILNGCECEPYLTSDHRLMVEHTRKVLEGAGILWRKFRPEKVFIGVEVNKEDAIETLRKEASHVDYPLEVVPLEVKYPQGAEKMLIAALLGVEVPSRGLPIDVGVVVSNVATVASIWELIRLGKPLMERVVTVTGSAAKRAGNFLIPLGTPLRDILEFCEGEDAKEVILGGPMMGMIQKGVEAPVIKGTSGVLALKTSTRKKQVYRCVRCSRCLDACPMGLNPSYLGLLARKELFE